MADIPDPAVPSRRHSGGRYSKGQEKKRYAAVPSGGERGGYQEGIAVYWYCSVRRVPLLIRSSICICLPYQGGSLLEVPTGDSLIV
jgi:hypothetical protein